MKLNQNKWVHKIGWGIVVILCLALITSWALALAITGCEPETKDIKGKYLVPEELIDCSFNYLYGSDGAALKIVRCLNSSTSTTYKLGRHSQSTVTVDGVEYVRKENSSEQKEETKKE